MSDELQKLISSERAAFNLPGFRRALVLGYTLSGGKLPVARQIFVQGATEYVYQELQASEDFPGPDSLKPLLIPKITDTVAKMMGKLFDDFVKT